MRNSRLPLMLCIALAAGPPAVQGGVYNTAEPDEGRLDRVPEKFRETLIILQSIAAPKVTIEAPLRRRYLFLETVYDPRDKNKLSAEQKLNFSAVLIRRGRYQDAILLLRDAGRQHPDVFLLQSNLATAYHLSGDKVNARSTMKDCIDAWPKDFHKLDEKQQVFLASIGWNEAPYGFYRDVEEKYFLKLLQLRSREPKMAGQFDAVDALFDVKFVGESGKFEPGAISKAEKAKLPANAREIVQQLLVWLPHDLRLQWLLGEVLNAQGDPESVKAAKKIIDELVWSYNIRAPELMARRQALNERVEPQQPVDDLNGNGKPPPPPPLVADWRGPAIAFVAGIVVAIFGNWQLRELRRRRRRT